MKFFGLTAVVLLLLSSVVVSDKSCQCPVGKKFDKTKCEVGYRSTFYGNKAAKTMPCDYWCQTSLLKVNKPICEYTTFFRGLQLGFEILPERKEIGKCYCNTCCVQVEDIDSEDVELCKANCNSCQRFWAKGLGEMRKSQNRDFCRSNDCEECSELQDSESCDTRCVAGKVPVEEPPKDDIVKAKEVTVVLPTGFDSVVTCDVRCEQLQDCNVGLDDSTFCKTCYGNMNDICDRFQFMASDMRLCCLKREKCKVDGGSWCDNDCFRHAICKSNTNINTRSSSIDSPTASAEASGSAPLFCVSRFIWSSPPILAVWAIMVQA